MLTIATYRELHDFVAAFGDDHLNMLMICSRGALGKSEEVRRTLNDEDVVRIGGLSETVHSYAHATSGDGSVIGGSTQTDDHAQTQAFRWTQEGGMISLGDLDSEQPRDSLALDVATNGLVVVGKSKFDSSPDMEAFRWTEEAGMVGLGDLPGGDHTSRAYAVSADGEIIVGYRGEEKGSG